MVSICESLHTGFSHRGLHIDLRIQVLPIRALLRWAERASKAGLNTLLIEWEGTFPFQRHPIIPNKFAYTGAEIRLFLDRCHELGLDVIPLQQCFGHIEYILRHARYAGLRESEKDLCQLCPCQTAKAVALFSDLFQELAGAHKSPFLHIGGDETYLLGQCPRCQAKSKNVGLSALYMDYFGKIARLAARLGKRPIVWADMLLRHPGAARQLPKSTILLDWNYGWEVDKFGKLANLENLGFEMWGAPALRSAPDNHALTCWEKHLDNFRDYLPFARSKNFQGMILTSWSTSGIYGYEWEQQGMLQEMHPVRRVYPMEGFRILFDAFVAALGAETKWVPEEFVRAYAVDHFGFAKPDAGKLWAVLQEGGEMVGPATEIGPLYLKALRAQRLLRRLKPSKNARDFAHLRLMVDLREHYLSGKALEARANRPSFRATSLFLANMNAWLKSSTWLHQRFVRLNRGNLYAAEQRAEFAFRTAVLRALSERLTRAGRGR